MRPVVPTAMMLEDDKGLSWRADEEGSVISNRLKLEEVGKRMVDSSKAELQYAGP